MCFGWAIFAPEGAAEVRSFYGAPRVVIVVLFKRDAFSAMNREAFQCSFVFARIEIFSRKTLSSVF